MFCPFARNFYEYAMHISQSVIMRPEEADITFGCELRIVNYALLRVVALIVSATTLFIELRVAGIIRIRFLRADFRQLFVKILANPIRICCVLCLDLPKIRSEKNLRPESANLLWIFG